MEAAIRAARDLGAHRRLARVARTSPSPAGRARCRCATCWPTWRARVPVRVLLWAGPPVPLFQPHEDHGAPGARRVRPGQPGAVCPRPPRADDALPPREDRDRRRRGRLRRRHRPHRAAGRPAGRVRAPAARLARLARRGDPLRGPGRRRRRRALPGAGRRSTGEQLAAAGRAAGGGRRDVQVLRTVPETTYRFSPRGEFGILEAYLRALRSRRTSSTSRTSSSGPRVVDVLADKLRDPPSEDFRILAAAPGQARATAPTPPAASSAVCSSRRRGRPAARHHDHRAPRRAAPAPVYVHAKVADRRRPVAHRRLGQPQRALAVQRHRDERPRAVTPRWRGRPGCGYGPSTPSARCARSRGSPPPSSTPCGGRRRRSRHSGSGRGCRARTGWRCCRACPDVPTGSRDRCGGCWWTGRAFRLLSCAGRPCGGWRAW